MTGASASPSGSRPTGEEWRAIADYEGLYEISNFGQVRSFHWHEPHLLVPVFNDKGYQTVKLYRDGVGTRQRIHRLVATAFHGDKQNVLHREVAHLDGDRANPHADNLQWVSRAENSYHKRAHGTHQAGETHPRAKLTTEQVLSVRASPESNCALARSLGVKEAAIRKIRQGTRWRHV